MDYHAFYYFTLNRGLHIQIWCRLRTPHVIPFILTLLFIANMGTPVADHLPASALNDTDR